MPPPVVILYTKPGCCLCDAAADVIADVARRRPLVLEKRNILDRLEDYERFKHAIPVIEVGGREIARYEITAEQLEAALGATSTPTC